MIPHPQVHRNGLHRQHGSTTRPTKKMHIALTILSVKVQGVVVQMSMPTLSFPASSHQSDSDVPEQKESG